MITTQKERISTFIKYKKLSNREFETICGLGNGFVSKIGKYIRDTKLELISKSFPELSIKWVETGVGEMIISKEYNHQIKESKNSKEETPHYEELVGRAIPHIDITTASCGLPNGFNTAITKEDCEKYIIPDLQGCDFTIRAGGRSMINRKVPERSINERDIVGCRLIKSRSHIRWGEVYALATCDGIIIKKIKESTKEGYITCISFNTDDGYEPYDIPVDEIYDWALVVGVVRVARWL